MQYRKLRAFHRLCVRKLCRITMRQTQKYHIKADDNNKKLAIHSFHYYYHNRILRWAGHVARMDMDRLPRKLLTSWVNRSRPDGRPDITWGQTLKKALKARDIPTDFDEWSALAQDRAGWRTLVNTSKPETAPNAKPTAVVLAPAPAAPRPSQRLQEGAR